ncbi:MAG TPA: hypothetical protein VMM18_00310 [Gemmatimonadaceae bacterium]|nr:hypothetical protein [Gemmatimonadaceae bacterium]
MAGGAAAAAAAAVARATKASGVIVRVQPVDFMRILERAEAPLVVVAEGGVFRRHVKYLTSYRGLAFFTKSDGQLVLPRQCEVVVADKIWIPD